MRFLMARPEASFLSALQLLINLCDPVRAKEADESQCEQAAVAALSASLLSPLASVALTADNVALVKLGVVALHQLTLQLHRTQVRRLKHRGLHLSSLRYLESSSCWAGILAA